jgi:hypothetical protein
MAFDKCCLTNTTITLWKRKKEKRNGKRRNGQEMKKRRRTMEAKAPAEPVQVTEKEIRRVLN